MRDDMLVAHGTGAAPAINTGPDRIVCSC
jgi:hypothetical protein